MIVLGFVLMIINVCICFYVFHLKRDVISDRRSDRVLLVVLEAILILICVFYWWISTKSFFSHLIGILLLGSSALVTFLLYFSFHLSESVKIRTKEISEALVGILDAGDSNLDGHSLHVCYLTMLLYEYLPLHYRAQINEENLRYAALFHDLGKLGIPGKILNKPGKLEGEEWNSMRRHPEIGVEILKPIRSFDAVSDWILYHHERMDGNGYYKLKGEEIPMAARMIAVADTYSAVVMARSYKARRTHEDSIAVLRMAAGTQLDQELVDIFCSIPAERIEKCSAGVRERMRGYLRADFRENKSLNI